MEQQKQKPIQEAMEIKPSVRTNRRFPAIITIVAVAISVAGILLLRDGVRDERNQVSPTPTSDSTLTEVEGWQTYRSDEFGFEIKYPRHLDIKEEKPTFQAVSFNETLRVEFFPTLKAISGSKEYFSLEEWLSKMASLYKGEVGSVTIGTNNYKGFSFKYSGDPGPQAFLGGIYIQHNDAVFRISGFKITGEFSELGNKILSTFRFIERGETALPTTCVNEPKGIPLIISLSQYDGPVGTKLEIHGCNFAGFEADKNAWIENAQGVKGILYGEAGSTSKLVQVSLYSPLCQIDTSYSGLPCDAWLTLTPGIYRIYVAPWGQKSNEVSFIILEKECTTEGNIPGNVMGYTPCCLGLAQRRVKTPINKANEVVCLEEMTVDICIKSGDKICGRGEDWCTSPEDCQKPNPKDLESF